MYLINRSVSSHFRRPRTRSSIAHCFIPKVHSYCFTRSTKRSDDKVTANEPLTSQASEAGREQSNHEHLRLIDAMQNAVSKQKAVFCCGGTVPIAAITDGSKEDRFDNVVGLITSPPVVLRWDLPSGKATGKLAFPPVVSNRTGTTAIEELLKSCAPATFSRQGKDVLDESYRKAVKLDSNQFSTSFNPCEVGIIDAIAQSLLPGVVKPFSDRESKYEEDLGVIAELYKLNIYSGPTGKFKAHVDTPRSTTQFGSLVVCLPHSHQGGDLRVSHGGQDLAWNWSNENPAAIKWAAFYSDCEHEIMEVKSGHRVTLTYNLYVHERIGGLMRHESAAKKNSPTLHHMAKQALASKSFMKDGGTLGFYCRHAYAHANEKHNKRLPLALKGVDAMFYSVFHHLGLQVDIRAVMENLEDYLDKSEKEHDSIRNAALVSTKLHTLQLNEEYDEDEYVTDRVKYAWESNWRNDITWFNEPGPKEIAVVHLDASSSAISIDTRDNPDMSAAQYGNDVSLKWHYSSAAILVNVPAFDSELRTQLAQEKEVAK